MYAFPAVIVAIMMSSALGPGNAVTIIATIAFYAPTSARIIRSASLPLMRAEWFLAARAYGRSRPRIYLRQVLPNIFPTIIVQSTLIFGGAILIAAILAYLGLGEQPPAPSWGRMLFDAQSYLDVAPFLAVWPGMAIVFSVLSANLIGDGLRDIYDVKGSTRS
jgi:peptide/nickel transport system permease protein